MVLKQSLVGAFISEPFIFSERASLSLNPFALRSRLALKNALEQRAAQGAGFETSHWHISTHSQLSPRPACTCTNQYRTPR